MPFKLKPINKKVVVREYDVNFKTSSGLYSPDSGLTFGEDVRLFEVLSVADDVSEQYGYKKGMLLIGSHVAGFKVSMGIAGEVRLSNPEEFYAICELNDDLVLAPGDRPILPIDHNILTINEL